MSSEDIPDRLSLTPEQDWEAVSAQMRDAALMYRECLDAWDETAERLGEAVFEEERAREVAELERLHRLGE